MVDHFDDRGHAATLVAHATHPGFVELDLARGVRPVAQLVLEALDGHGVARAVGPPAWEEKAREPSLGLGEGEEPVAHRRRTEPLVAGDQVFVTGEMAGGGRVGPNVAAALLFGHRHATGQPRLLFRRDEPTVVAGGGQAGLPLGEQLGIVPHRRDDRIRHRGGTHVATVGLVPDDHLGAPGDVGARAVLCPRGCAQPLADRHGHQLVIAGMEAHLVDALAVAVVGQQLWGVGVGRPSPLLGVLATGEPSDALEVGTRPAGPLALQRPGQRRVGAEDVVVDQGAALVRHIMSGHDSSMTVPGRSVQG